MQIFTRLIWAVGLVVLLNSPLSYAAAPTGDPAVDSTTDARLDLGVPDSPLFVAMGLAPSEVIRPGSPKELVTSLLSGVDQNGNVQTGFALDLSPYMLGFGDQVTLHHYRDNYMTRLLARSQLSVATAKGSDEEDESTRLGIGIRITPFDLGDPRTDKGLSRCFKDKLTRGSSKEADALRALADEIEDRAIEDAENGLSDEQIQARNAAETARLGELSSASVSTCRSEARALNWNRSSWTLGAAPSWIGKDGGFGNLKFGAATFWSSVAWGFEKVPGLERGSQFLVSVKYAIGEQVPDEGDDPGAFEERDTLSIGSQLRMAVFREEVDQANLAADAPPWLIAAIEGDYVFAEREHLPDDKYYKVAVTADVKIPSISSTYFKLSVGGTGGRKDGANDGFVLGSFNYGF